jgi:hypothetical protein
MPSEESETDGASERHLLGGGCKDITEILSAKLLSAKKDPRRIAALESLLQAFTNRGMEDMAVRMRRQIDELQGS